MLTRSALTIRLHPNDDVVIARTHVVAACELLQPALEAREQTRGILVGLVGEREVVGERAELAHDAVERHVAIERIAAPGSVEVDG